MRRGISVLVCLVACFCFAQVTDVQAEIRVYDADGQYLGLLSDADNAQRFLVFIPSLSMLVAISLVDGNVTTGRLLFSDESCSGTHYLAVTEAHYISRLGTVLFAGQAAPSLIEYRSVLQEDGCETYVSRNTRAYPDERLRSSRSNGTYVPPASGGGGAFSGGSGSSSSSGGIFGGGSSPTHTPTPGPVPILEIQAVPALEIAVTGIPFSLPVSLPLRLEYAAAVVAGENETTSPGQGTRLRLSG